MLLISATNVNDALYKGNQLLEKIGVKRDSRNGSVIVAPYPVTTIYEKPWQKVLINKHRDANPFFHLIEAWWMLAGRDDLKPLLEFVPSMKNYSDDDGITQSGAYGYRWRHWFDKDQIDWAINRLRDNKDDRRVVIQMYDAYFDQDAADSGGKDIPCNLMALPWIDLDGALNLTVFNRSNDMVWGAYGANAVHFATLLEYMAWQLNVPIGRYLQVSNNFHAYEATIGKAQGEWVGDPYMILELKSFRMFESEYPLDHLTDDLDRFLDDPARPGIRSDFLRKVACPMVLAHRDWKKNKDPDAVKEIVSQMHPKLDWTCATVDWFENRFRALDDGVHG